MLSKKFRLRKLNTIIATSVLMGACLIFGQGQDASATGFRGVNSGASGAGRGRGTGTPSSSSNLGGAGRGSSASSIGTGSGNLGASGNLGGSGRRSSIGTGLGDAGSSTSSGSPSSSGIRGMGSSASSGSGNGSKWRVQRLVDKIQSDIETGNGPDIKPYKDLLDENPDFTKKAEEGTYYKFTSGIRTVEILVGHDGDLKSAFIDTGRGTGSSGLSSSSVSGASSSTSSASGSASSGADKAKVQQLFDKIREDIEKESGFSNPGIYKELLTHNPDSINDLGDGRLKYKYSSGGGTVEMVVDSGDGSVKSALVDIGGDGGFINFDEGWSQTSSR